MNANAEASKVVAQFRKLRLVPVLVIDDARQAVALGRALRDGGLPCAEITFRTPAALESIRRMAEACPDLLVGAGTVLTPGQAQSAREAGARFIVSPGFGPAVVDYCLEQSIPVFPGVCTPTEIELALSKGLRVLKFFPAEPIGGLPYLKAIAAPYGDVLFIPTGGINLTNLPTYLKSKSVLACGGSWMAPAELVASGEFERIRLETARACSVVSAVDNVAGANVSISERVS